MYEMIHIAQQKGYNFEMLGGSKINFVLMVDHGVGYPSRWPFFVNDTHSYYQQPKVPQTHLTTC